MAAPAYVPTLAALLILAAPGTPRAGAAAPDRDGDASPAIALEADPPLLVLRSPAAVAPLRVTAILADGTSRDVTRRGSGIVYTIVSGGDGVITIDFDGIVQAVRNGVDTVLAAYAGLVASAEVRVEITNRPPEMATLDDITLRAGASLDLPLSVWDADGDTLRLEVTDAPPFATFVDLGNGNGMLHVRPRDGDGGTWSLTFRAEDDGSPPQVSEARVQMTILPCARPPGAPPLLSAGEGGDLTWTAVKGAIGYDAVYGSLTALSRTRGSFARAALGCLADDTPATALSFAAVPAPGEGFWILVRDVHCGGNGTWDGGGAGRTSPRDRGLDDAAGGCGEKMPD